MQKLVKIDGMDFQPVHLILRDRNEEFVNQLGHNHPTIHETVQKVTEDHFPKLYEQLVLRSKPFARELQRITRNHFLNSPRQTTHTGMETSPDYTAPTARQSRPYKLRPINGQVPDRLNISCMGKFSRNKQNAKDLPSLNLNHSTAMDEDLVIPNPTQPATTRPNRLESLDSARKHYVPTLIKLDSIKTPARSGSKTKRNSPFIHEGLGETSERFYLPSQIGNLSFGRASPSVGSKDMTEKTTLSPAVLEKHREKVTRLEADRLLNPDNPEFIKLIRLITGDEKSPSIKSIKISREQIKIHLLRKYPSVLAEKFLKLIDLPQNFEVMTYLEYFKNILLDSLDLPYFLCFSLFDFNNDDIINHRDIFSLLKLLKDFPLLQKDFLKILYKPEKTTQKGFTLKLFPKSSVPRTPHEKRASGLNTPKLSDNISILKNLEMSIEKTKSNRISTLSQLRMIYSTGIPSYLNYKKGKYKHKSLLEMSGYVPPVHNKKNSIILDQTQSNRMSPLGLSVYSNQGEKSIDVSPVQKVASVGTNKEYLEVISSWGETGIDLKGFAEIFDTEMPFILYDLLFYCTLLNLPGREKFQAFDVFDYYEKPYEPQMNNTLNKLYNRRPTTLISTNLDDFDAFNTKNTTGYEFYDNE